jgi:Domain of unknown function (DUF397)
VDEKKAQLAWCKSSYSGTGDCVEWRVVGKEVHLRNSRFPNDGQLVFSCREWFAFIAGVKAGEADIRAEEAASMRRIEV